MSAGASLVKHLQADHVLPFDRTSKVDRAHNNNISPARSLEPKEGKKFWSIRTDLTIQPTPTTISGSLKTPFQRSQELVLMYTE
jgi:hypothetical protein